MSDQTKRFHRLHELNLAFTPGAPIRDLDSFAGRWDLISDVYNVLFQTGQHVALFGDRGVGKTSLANILGQSFSSKTKMPIRSVRVSCATGDTFHTLWSQVFRKLEQPLDSEWRASVPSIVEILTDLDYRALIVIDELDRFDDQEGLSLLADTIKALSDEALDATIVIVGVSDTIEDLIGDHRSVGRALVQLKVDRMAQRDLSQIVTGGLERLQMTASGDDVARIARLSEGLPHYTHLLAYYAAERAIQDDRHEVLSGDVDRAIAQSVQKAQDTIRQAYAKAIFSPRPDNLFEQVLIACALARKNEIGSFSPRDVQEPLNKILNRAREIGISAYVRHLNEFTTEAHGEILQKRGEHRKWQYRFTDPMVQPFAILKGIAKGTISEGLVSSLRPPEPSQVPDFCG